MGGQVWVGVWVVGVGWGVWVGVCVCVWCVVGVWVGCGWVGGCVGGRVEGWGRGGRKRVTYLYNPTGQGVRHNVEIFHNLGLQKEG